MSASGVLAGKGYVKIGLDDSELFSGIRQMQARMRSVGESIRNTGAGLFSVGATGIAAFIPAVLMASDAAEGFNRFQALMGEETKRTDAALDEMSNRIGRVKSELRDTASSFQGLLVGLGMNKAEAAKLSTTLTELSLDFASFNNLSDAEASERFLAGLSGSGEVFDRFGINIKEAQLKIKLAEMGIKGTATELQKAQARIAIIQESMQRQGATRDATTTAASFANQLKAIAAQAKQAAQEVGQFLIPEILKYTPGVLEAMKSGVKWVVQNKELVVQVASMTVAVTAGGVALMAIGQSLKAIGQSLKATAGAIDIAVAAWKVFQPLLDPKDMLEWVNAAEKAQHGIELFLASLVIGGVVAFAYELSQAREEFEALNDELERNDRLNKQLNKRYAKEDQQRQKQRLTTEQEVLAALAEEEQRINGLNQSAQGMQKQMDSARAKWREDNTAFGLNPWGGAALESEQADLKLINDRLDAARERANELRKKLEEIKSAKTKQLSGEAQQTQQVTSAVKQKAKAEERALTIVERQTRAAQNYLTLVNRVASSRVDTTRNPLINPGWKEQRARDRWNAQVGDEFALTQRLRNPLAKRKAPSLKDYETESLADQFGPSLKQQQAAIAAKQKQMFRSMTESITGTFSGAALAGQSAQATLRKRSEDTFNQIEKNTSETAKKIDDLARSLTYA